MLTPHEKVVIKDSTLREGLDTTDVVFTWDQKVEIAGLLDEANVPEIEIVAPGNVLSDLEFVKKLKEEGLKIRTSGLVYAHNPRFLEEIGEASKCLDRFDVLMPVSPKRKPHFRDEKMRVLLEGLVGALRLHSDVGVGFPHSTEVEVDFLIEMGREAGKHGAKRVTIYDTSGSSDPFGIYDLIKRLKAEFTTALFFHAHNDLGLATANSLSAVYAGADGLDVTINGLGDRAGNASLEQVLLGLYLKDIDTGVVLKDLPGLSRTVEEASGVKVSKFSPIVGEYVFFHKSPSHLENPELFEAFDPAVIGSRRKLNKPG